MIDILAQQVQGHEGPTWSQFFAVLGIASGVPSALVTWLHLRLNKIADQNSEQVRLLRQEMDNRFESVKKEHKTDMAVSSQTIAASSEKMFAHLGEHYIQKGEIGAKFDNINRNIQSVGDRLDDFLDLYKRVDEKQQAQAERLTRLETKCAEKHKAAG